MEPIFTVFSDIVSITAVGGVRIRECGIKEYLVEFSDLKGIRQLGTY